LRSRPLATPNSALMRAASKGQEAATQLLLQHKVNTELTDHNGWTALMWATRGGHLDIVKILIAGGVDVNVKAKDGRTAIVIARNEDFKDILDELKKAGAKQ
jgi:ankyrin repeat protein